MSAQVALGRQRGATLLIAMIMLILITLMVVGSFKLGEGNLKIVGNMQTRQQAQGAAQAAIDLAVSSDLFVSQPTAVFLNPCVAGANTQCMDVNNDGTDDVTVTITPAPSCVIVTPIMNDDLDLSNDADLNCSIGQSQESFSVGGGGGGSGASQCSDSVWELRAEAVDVQSGARAAVLQGVGIRVANDNVAAACP